MYLNIHMARGNGILSLGERQAATHSCFAISAAQSDVYRGIWIKKGGYSQV
ncbi:hypothetical protein [Burkholderia ubonensis]|uniref:hypothetical protein n=1 Tax=Burkholderia ubonensis TaxID=101571 RepID=UPI000AB8CFCD|nr:hypothetical protein [Burkholderia ubonensis]